MSLLVGLDLVTVDAVAESIDRFAERYLLRVYTDNEIVDCRDAGGALLPQRLAARFAAKEAVLKVLRTADDAIPWRHISIGADRYGAPSVALSGRARAAARRRGVQSIAVSLTHEPAFAAAVAIAQLRDPS